MRCKVIGCSIEVKWSCTKCSANLCNYGSVLYSSFFYTDVLINIINLYVCRSYRNITWTYIIFWSTKAFIQDK